MTGLSRAGRSGATTLSLLAILALGAASVSAEGPDQTPSARTVFIIALPVAGLAVLLLAALPALLRRTYPREVAAVHFAKVIALSSVVGLLTTLIVTHAFWPGYDSTLSLSAAGVFALLLMAGMFQRYLLISFRWAVLAGGAVAVAVVSLAYVAMEVPASTVERVVDLLLHTLPLWVILWLVLLALETTRHHLSVGDPVREHDRPGLPRRRQVLRLGELLIVNMASAAGLLLLVAS